MWDFCQRPLSPPRAKTPIVPDDGDVAPNDEVSFAPRDCRLDYARRYTIHGTGAVRAFYKDVDKTCVL